MQEAQYYKKNNSHIQCYLCHHKCLIANTKTDRCGIRLHDNGKLFSLNFSRPVVQNIDPVEKKPLYHFLPGTSTYSIGALGCNFKCGNCQNYDISQIGKLKLMGEEIDFVTPMRIVEEALGNGCESISYTYSEPTVFAEFALEVMKLARKYDLKNIWVSNGFMSEELLLDIIPFLDAINVDIKSMDNRFYEKVCEAKLDPILENLKTLKQEQVHLELTTLIIPEFSDDTRMLAQMAEFIASELDEDTPLHLSKFSPEISWKMKHQEATGEDIIYEAYELAKDAGLKYVYVGNIPGDQKENTYCPRCGELAISRMGYQIERLDNGGRCGNCDRSLDIIE